MEQLLYSKESNPLDGLSWWLWTLSPCHPNIFFFQQACGLSKRTSHPSQGTSIPSGRGDLAVLAQACMESCHVTACDSAWDHTCLLSEPALGNEREEPTSRIAGGQGWHRRGWHRLRVLCGLGEPCWLQPLPQHKPMSSQEEFKGSKAILKGQGFGQRWLKHCPS